MSDDENSDTELIRVQTEEYTVHVKSDDPEKVSEHLDAAYEKLREDDIDSTDKMCQ